LEFGGGQKMKSKLAVLWFLIRRQVISTVRRMNNLNKESLILGRLK